MLLLRITPIAIFGSPMAGSTRRRAAIDAVAITPAAAARFVSIMLPPPCGT